MVYPGALFGVGHRVYMSYIVTVRVTLPTSFILDGVMSVYIVCILKKTT